jgi:hypothetical protein
MYMIIIIGINVVDNLNSVKVINKPCMSSRNIGPPSTVIANSKIAAAIE